MKFLEKYKFFWECVYIEKKSLFLQAVLLGVLVFSVRIIVYNCWDSYCYYKAKSNLQSDIVGVELIEGKSKEMVLDTEQLMVSEKETEVISERDEDTEDLLMDSSRWQHMERSARDLFVDKDTVETYSKKNWIVFMIGLLVLLIITLLLTAYFLISWIQNDFPNETIPYLAGLGIGILFLLDGIFQSGKKCRRTASGNNTGLDYFESADAGLYEP